MNRKIQSLVRLYEKAGYIWAKEQLLPSVVRLHAGPKCIWNEPVVGICHEGATAKSTTWGAISFIPSKKED